MTDAREVHIKRPMNAFMIWSSQKRKDLARENPCLHNSQISKILGIEWRQLGDEEKRRCFAQANLLKELHMIQYPSYKYRPKRRAKRTKRPKRATKHNYGVFSPCLCPEPSQLQLDSTKESYDQETSSTSTGKDYLDVKQQTAAAVVKFEDDTEDTRRPQLPEHEDLIEKNRENSCLGKVANWPQSSAFENSRGGHDGRNFQGVHDDSEPYYNQMSCLSRPPEDLRGAGQGRVSREILRNYIGHLQVPHYASMDAMFRYRRTMNWQFLK